MKRIVAVSDSHHDYHSLEQVAQRHTDAAMLLHLGDGYHEFSCLCRKFPEQEYRIVRGNCDYDAPEGIPMASLVQICKAKIFFTHGHLYGVKEDLQRLYLAGLEQGANVILYGHTHIPKIEFHNGVYLMNPGSLGQPRLGKKTYALIDVEEAGVFCHLCDVNPAHVL